MTDLPPNLLADEYFERIEGYVHSAEDHLQVPRGTIWAMGDDSDFVAVIKAYGVVEPLLRQLVREQLKANYRAFGSGSGASDEMIKAVVDLPVDRLRTIACEFGAITQGMNEFIQALGALRHRYAHNIVNMPLSISELCAKIGDANLQRKLVGLPKELSPSALQRQAVRTLMFHNLAQFLGAALHTLKPPPRSELGLLGIFSFPDAEPRS